MIQTFNWEEKYLHTPFVDNRVEYTAIIFKQPHFVALKIVTIKSFDFARQTKAIKITQHGRRKRFLEKIVCFDLRKEHTVLCICYLTYERSESKAFI